MDKRLVDQYSWHLYSKESLENLIAMSVISDMDICGTTKLVQAVRTASYRLVVILTTLARVDPERDSRHFSR